MLLWCVWVVGGVTVADDTPPGTDLVARIEVGRLAPEVRRAWKELEPLFDAWPSLGGVATGALDSWAEVVDLLEQASSADLDRRSSVVTLVVDADAAGGLVWAAVIRGARPREPAEHDFLIDAHPAHRLAAREMAWSKVGDALVAGNERGVQRQVRQEVRRLRGARAKRSAKEPLQTRAERLRQRAPLVLAFEAPAPVRARLGASLANVGALVSAIHSGTLVAAPGRLWLQLSADTNEGQLALEHGLRALVALIRASVALLEGGAEAVIGLELLGARPKSLPVKLEAPALETLAAKWLDRFHVDGQIRKRRPQVVEAELSLSSYRGLAAALGVMAAILLPAGGAQAEAEVLLELLRRAQRQHHARTGSFVSCGPVPAQLPVGPTSWPEGSCFDALQFSPPADVRFQLVAGVEDGELVLMARGDTNGDGDAEIWVLEEKDVAARPLIIP
jgi:hypothetical protein